MKQVDCGNDDEFFKTTKQEKKINSYMSGI